MAGYHSPIPCRAKALPRPLGLPIAGRLGQEKMGLLSKALTLHLPLPPRLLHPSRRMDQNKVLTA